ncbi:MAG: class I SAM-dependent methyltransferase [Armatimonadetes bacterium]|nr:class I SAM-dependent methyltransferase [Armatimonadota bacterium]
MAVSSPRPLRRLLRAAAFTNAATFWVLLREGKGPAFCYLKQMIGCYDGRTYLPWRATTAPTVPEMLPGAVFPEADVAAIELLHPLPAPGGINVLELLILTSLAAARQPRRIVEIGVAAGRTTINLAAQAPQAEIIAVDLPPEAPEAADSAGPDYRQLGLEQPGRLFLGQPAAERITLLLADSTRHDWSAYHGSVDLIFIDGAHDYQSVKADSENALAMLRPGGLIFWHDYSWVEGVTRYLNELHQRRQLVWLGGTHLACLAPDRPA